MAKEAYQRSINIVQLRVDKLKGKCFTATSKVEGPRTSKAVGPTTSKVEWPRTSKGVGPATSKAVVKVPAGAVVGAPNDQFSHVEIINHTVYFT